MANPLRAAPFVDFYPKANRGGREAPGESAIESSFLQALKRGSALNATSNWNTKPGMPNQALEQTRDSVLRYGESVGCELLNFFVRQQEAQSRSHEARAMFT